MIYQCEKCGSLKTEIFSRYITKNGKRIYRKDGKVFRFLGCSNDCKKK